MLLHWIYPRLCELCHKPCEHELCDSCRESLPRVPMPICLYCGSPVAGEQDDPYHCAHCRAMPRSFDFARSALTRSEDAMQLIYALKYHHANYLARALGHLLNELWEDTPALCAHRDWCLVPVPSGVSHLFQRGYNQAEELARALGKQRGLRVHSPLMRRNTGVDSQTRLSAAERRRNAQAAYALRHPEAKLSSPHLVLVDDVYTTGSTVRVCARLLRQLPGVKTVGVLTLLRAMRQPLQGRMPLRG